jgi:hypothetical protein
MMANRIKQTALVPGLPEAGTNLRISGREATIPMVIAMGAVICIWAFDSLRRWPFIPASLTALAIALFLSIYFGSRAVRKDGGAQHVHGPNARQREPEKQ